MTDLVLAVANDLPNPQSFQSVGWVLLALAALAASANQGLGLMQQPGDFGFCLETQWGGKGLGQVRDIAKVIRQRLPLCLVRIAATIRKFSRMGVAGHFKVGISRVSRTTIPFTALKMGAT